MKKTCKLLDGTSVDLRDLGSRERSFLRAAVYKAIDRGTLEAQRIGNVTVVARDSALEYRDRGRQPETKRSRRLETATG